MSRADTRLLSISSHLRKAAGLKGKMSLVPENPSSVLSTLSPLAGAYKPLPLRGLFYGPECVGTHLLSVLPSRSSKAFVITGSSLATKTPLIQQVEDLLTSAHHAGTFSDIKQHAPVADLDNATDMVRKDQNIDTIISIGGGSPIDSAKAISHRLHEKTGSYLTHIAIPTTLSAAECSGGAGYTREDGVKTGVQSPYVAPVFIFYDPSFGVHTPPYLFMSTGIRSLDHAIELHYHPTATEMPCRMIARTAAQDLFEYLPKYKADPKNQDVITKLFLAAYASYAFLGTNLKGSLGLSHSLGYALGSPYAIPHGVTSCLTLGHVAKLKASTDSTAQGQLARLLPFVGGSRTGDDKQDSTEVGDRILQLVQDLGLTTTLTEKGVGRDQVDIIVQRATGGQKEGEVYDAVKGLVEELY